jgi:hypothetical protein
MAGTTVKSRLTLGVAGSVSRHMAIEHNKLVDDVELVRAGARQVVSYDIEDLAGGADISARAIYVAPRASTIIDSVKCVYEAASSGVDSGNTSVVTLRNITEGVNIASMTLTATTSANAAESLTLTASAADIAANDVLGIVVTNGATADTPKMILQFEIQPQTIDAAGDMTAAKIGDDSGTAYSA